MSDTNAPVKPTYVLVTIGNHAVGYELWQTTAPANYDGFGTLTLLASEHEGKIARIVLIQAQHAAWQTGRYRSGLFGAEPSDMLTQHDVAERLYETLASTLTYDAALAR